MKARMILGVAALLLLGACAQATVDTTTLSASTPSVPSEDSTAVLDGAADEICAQHAWTGIREPASFTEAAAVAQMTPEVVAAAVRRRCPDSFYEPLSRAEIDWCGEGMSFGKNFFLVVKAGVDLGIESFSIVEPALIAKASNRSVELSDYEIELLTAELQTMSESQRFERDWAEACRSTF